MADRTIVAVREDRSGRVLHYYADGWVLRWDGPGRWSSYQLPDPERVHLASQNDDMEPNRELAPEVAHD